MVLPPSPADALAPAPPPAWIVRLSALLELAPASVMILVEAPDHASIGAFIRAVGDRFGHVFVVAEMEELLALPEGSLVALCPRAEDAEWLNIKRPWIVEHSLRVLIWADRELAGVLHERAPDFFDWISHHQECPPTPPEFAIRGLQLAREGPGIVWGGTPEEFIALLRQVEPEAEIVTIDAGESYPAILEAIAAADGAWIQWIGVDGPFRVRRVRWALAEQRRVGRSALIGLNPRSPGWSPLHARRAPLHELSAVLKQIGVREAARLATLADLDGDLLVVASALAKLGAERPDVEKALTVEDPTAGIAALLSLSVAASARALPYRLQSQRRRKRLLLRQFRRDERVDADAMATVTATARWGRAFASRSQTPLVRGWQVEALLRGGSRTPSEWLSHAEVAGELGDHAVQFHWVLQVLPHMDSFSNDESVLFFKSYLEAIKANDHRSMSDELLSALARGIDPGEGLMSSLLLREYADILVSRGRLREAESTLRRALQCTATSPLEEPTIKERIATLEAIIDVLDQLGQEGEATALERELTALETSQGDKDPGSTEKTPVEDDEPDEGELRAAIQRCRAELGPEHPSVIRSMVALAEHLHEESRYEDAAPLLLEAHQLLADGCSADAELTADIHGLLLKNLAARGLLTEAERLFRRSSRRLAEYAGREHPAYFRLVGDYVDLLIEHENYEQAEKLLARLAKIASDAFGPASELCRDTILRIIELRVSQRRWEKAETLLKRLVRLLRRSAIKDPDLGIRTELLRAAIERGQSRFPEAERTLRRLLERIRRFPREDWLDLHREIVDALGDLLVGLARYADAVALYRQIIADTPELTDVLRERLELAEAQAAAQDSSAPTE